MASLTVKGVTLGQKHRNYNKLVNEAIKTNPTQQITAINYDESDTDNLLKIDLACKSRNVEYILDALECEDMFYVSRVIKKSTWLITDTQYSYIINPDYLHNTLQPRVTSKAFNKLILHVRLNLKDEKRVEEFFNHFQHKDMKKAFRWLLHCSVPFAEKILQKHANDIPRHLLKRLYEKSFTFLQIIRRNYTATYYNDHMIMPGKFLINRNLEEFLDMAETLKRGECFSFGPKYTRSVMEKNPERVMNNLEKYVYFLHIPTFAKYLKSEEVKGFILTHIKNMETRQLFTYKKIKHFLYRLPFEERFDFVNKVFIEKSCGNENLSNKKWDDIVEYCNLPPKFNLVSSKNIWSWYVYAPFDKAFADLKQMIRNESNPTERLWILRTLITCAGSDQTNILTLLKYYHDNHISEPFIFKVQFVNHFITKTDSRNYDEETWRYLNDLFNSLDLSTKDSVESCVKFIVLHNVTHDKYIPEAIEGKFNFEYFIKYEYEDCKHKFNTEEREKIFNYFYKHYTSKITNDITTEHEFDENVKIIINVLYLLYKWNKELIDYPFILGKIKDLIIKEKESSWSRDLSEIYNFKKTWRRILHPVSIILNPTQETCINALKHEPELLEIHRKEIESSLNDNLVFNRFLRKIRIDWHRPLADSFKTNFKESLNLEISRKTSIRGMCTLLSQEELVDFVQKYAPQKAKIDWSQPGDMVLCIRQSIGTYMHLARRHPPLSVALLYAKGDYLHYVLPSLNAISHNMSSNQFSKHVAQLLNAPVSLQKHCIRVAFAKLNHEALRNVFPDLWGSTKNRSIRKHIFCETYKMICRESDEKVIKEMWKVLCMFIDKLTFDENRKIYSILSQAENLPLSVREEFLMKSCEFIKKAPVQGNFKNIIADLIAKESNMEFLDIDFMGMIFFENFDENFTAQKYRYCRQVALYLLSTKSESVQRERYDKIFEPLVSKAIAGWNKRHKNTYYARNNLRDIFDCMFTEFEDLVLNKGMVFPIAIYTDILNKLQNVLPLKENYVLLTCIKLSLGYVKILNELKTKCSEEKYGSEKSEHLNKLYNIAAPIFGKLCLDYLKQDIANNCSTIYILFAQALKLIFDRYVNKNHIYKMRILKCFLDSEDCIKGYLLVMDLMPSYYHDDEEEIALRSEIFRKISMHPSEEVAMHYRLLRKNDVNL